MRNGVGVGVGLGVTVGEGVTVGVGIMVGLTVGDGVRILVGNGNELGNVGLGGIGTQMVNHNTLKHLFKGCAAKTGEEIVVKNTEKRAISSKERMIL